MDTGNLMARSAVATLLALGASVALSSSASATVFFNSAYAYASASAEADPTGTGFATSVGTGDDGELATALPSGPFTAISYAESEAQALAPKSLPIVQAEASDTELVQGSFADAATGTIDFQGSALANVNTLGAGAFSGNDGNFYVYTFTVDQKSVLNLDYTVADNSTNASFFPGYSAYVYDGSYNYYLDAESLQNTSGLVSSNVLGPGTYSLEVDDAFYNDFASSTGGLQSASAIGDFGFSISAVPEPATWGTMLLGFGLAGTMMRRSRRGRLGSAAV